jgi:hypothetical protein
MTADFGVRRGSKGPPWGMIMAGAAVLLVGLAAVFSRLSHLPAQIAAAKAWTIEGPPCPELTKAAFAAQPMKAEQLFAYDGIGFARAYGHAECNEIADHGGKGWSTYPVCKFTGPALLQVSNPKDGDHFFAPPAGVAATLSFQDRRVACVTGPNGALTPSPIFE